MKAIRIILLSWCVMVMLLIMAGIIIAKYYEDDVTQYVIEELNKNINTEITVNNVKLSLIKKFPYASVTFSEITVFSSTGFLKRSFNDHSTDTLLNASRVNLQLNVPGIFSKKYKVKQLHMDQGKLNVFIDHEGKGNYRFWKEPQGQNDNFEIELENVKFTDFFIRHVNLAKATELQSFLDKANLKGKLYRKNYYLSMNIQGKLDQFSKDEIKYLKDEFFSLRVLFHVENNTYSISNGYLKIADLGFNLDGNLTKSENTEVSVLMRGENLDIRSLFSRLPLKNRNLNKNIQARGKLSVRTSFEGLFSTIHNPHIESTFTINNGSLQLPENESRITGIHLNGKYTNGQENNGITTRIQLEDVTAEIINTRLNGYFRFENLLEPTVEYYINGRIDLDNLLTILKPKRIIGLEGIINSKIRIRGNQSELLKISRDDLRNFDYDGYFVLDDVGFRLKDKPVVIKHVFGTTRCENFLIFNDLSANVSGNNLNISGRIDNVLDYLLTKDGNLWADLDIFSEDISFKNLINIGDSSAERGIATGVRFPERLYVKSDFWFDKLNHNRINFEIVRGSLLYQPGKLYVPAVAISGMNGQVSAEGFIEQQQDHGFLLKISTDLQQVDIKKFFYSFNNFKQEFIRDEHLRGKFSGKVNLSAEFDSTLKFRKESLLAEADFEIKDGELISFEPMLGLSRFINVEELEHIRFSTLENQIFIRDNEVIIPQMDIHSSAINISGSGTHEFDNYYNYKVQVSLSELLSGKATSTNADNQEFGVIKDDGLGRTIIYLAIEGTPEGYKVKYDRKGAVQALKEKISNEKYLLKDLFREEFRISRQDTTMAGEHPGTGESGFLIDWEEDGMVTNKKKGDTIIRTEKPKFIIEWDDEWETDSLKKKK